MPDPIFIWLVCIPLLPLVVAAMLVICPPVKRQLAGRLAVGAQALALIAALVVCSQVLTNDAGGEPFRQAFNFGWFQLGPDTIVPLGLLLDTVNAPLLLMVTLVGLLVFIYASGYMANDPRALRFFSFLSFFSAAMLGLLVANSLLLLFICWELVGLASYLLIGFWYQKQKAARAARKAFLVTRVGDLGLFLGMIWLDHSAGTLLFYDGGAGLLEATTLGALAAPVAGGFSVATITALLLFVGAAGKSGQVPLHVWLPDAMEGPTPVSALIHAATMVAAGVFLVARSFPLFEASANAGECALTVVAWTGAVTALLAACVAVAQSEIKRILAYSTVSQLGFMMLALGVGGLAAALFHLLAHAFFKALLFLGAGSVSHGCDEEKDVLRMGGLRGRMPATFACYAIGMMALAGFPFFFSGFWSKEAILHAAHAWPISQGPFFVALAATLLTAFYMSRQMLLVFFGKARTPEAESAQESPRRMTGPMAVLAVMAILPLIIATPAWPWFSSFVRSEAVHFELGHLFSAESLPLLLGSILLVALGVVLAWWLYRPGQVNEAADPLERRWGSIFRALKAGLYFDAFYDATVVAATGFLGRVAASLDCRLWSGLANLPSALVRGLATLVDAFDRATLNRGFELACSGLRSGGAALQRAHHKAPQTLLTAIGLGALGLLLILAWL
ncbi:MAG: NADH-quinone oxidoreductase subunit L [Opitutales bacterium]